MTRHVQRSCPLIDSRKHIRVLDIAEPDLNGGDEHDVHGLLRTVDLDTKPKFTALSYVWGERTSDDPVINCGSEKISVTQNCFSALQSLRNQLGAFSIWVDAICIDQENEAEMFHQLPLMHRIYGEAEHVYVWLGKGDRDVEYVLSAMHHIGLQRSFDRMYSSSNPYARVIALHKTRAFVWKWQWQYTCRNASSPRTWTVPIVDDPDGHYWYNYHGGLQMSHRGYLNGDLMELERFFDNSWLERIWTFQEIMLARNPVLVYGTVSVPWESFIISTLYLSWIVGEDNVKNMSAWRNLALSRAHLLSSIDQQNTELEKLQHYQKYLHQIACQSSECCAVSWSVQTIYILRYFSVLTLFGFIAGLISLRLVDYRVLPLHSPVFRFAIVVVGFCIQVCVIFNALMLLRRISPIPRRGPLYLEAGRSSTLTESLMLALRHRSVSNRRDYNLGVRAVLQMMDGTSLCGLRPDISIEDSYRDLSLEILTRLSCPYPVLLGPLTNRLDSPSWAVNWAQSIEPLWQTYIHEVCFRRDSCATQGSFCDWSNNDSRTQSLRTKGCVIGEITALNSLDAEVDKETEALKALILLFGGSTADNKDLLPHGSSWNELASSIPRGTRLECAESLLQSRMASGSPDNRIDVDRFWKSKLGKRCEALRATNSLTFSMTNVNDSNTAGGIAHRGAAVGDSVVLLAGVPIPVVMRFAFIGIEDDPVKIDRTPNGTGRTIRYMKIVSPAGVCGMMRGQGWPFGKGDDLSYIGIV